jgi:hypothetical protein
MKKFAFIFIMFFALFVVVSDTIIANTDTEYDKALKYYNSGKYKEAVTLFKEYVKKNPKPSAYYRIGYALYELGKYDEATEYFKEAYLVDPTFSPELGISTQGYPEEITKTAGKQVPSRKKTLVSEATEKQPEIKPEAPPEKQLPGETQPQKTQETKVTPGQGAPAPEPQKIEPRQRVQPPAGMPTFPKPKEGLPFAVPGFLSGLIAGLGMILIALEIAIYIYVCLCIFLIAKKLDVTAPWIAFIPIIQIWTIVSCAGKPWWWILLLLVPIVNIIVGVYIWMCITENLGKNRWLGLLMLLPIINFVFLGILAFSKTEKFTGTAEDATLA